MNNLLVPMLCRRLLTMRVDVADLHGIRSWCEQKVRTYEPTFLHDFALLYDFSYTN